MTDDAVHDYRLPLVLLGVYRHQHRDVLRPEQVGSSAGIHPLRFLPPLQSRWNTPTHQRHLCVRIDRNIVRSTRTLRLRRVEELLFPLGTALVAFALRLAGATIGHFPH